MVLSLIYCCFVFPLVPVIVVSFQSLNIFVFVSLHLQGKVAQTACMSACKHLSTSLLQLLLEADVRQVSMGALQQFNVDVKECESEYDLCLLNIRQTCIR